MNAEIQHELDRAARMEYEEEQRQKEEAARPSARPSQGSQDSGVAAVSSNALGLPTLGGLFSLGGRPKETPNAA